MQKEGTHIVSNSSLDPRSIFILITLLINRQRACLGQVYIPLTFVPLISDEEALIHYALLELHMNTKAPTYNRDKRSTVLLRLINSLDSRCPCNTPNEYRIERPLCSQTSNLFDIDGTDLYESQMRLDSSHCRLQWRALEQE